jgi:tripartite-type tricarboxylate transporter receptor subunit TctC
MKLLAGLGLALHLILGIALTPGVAQAGHPAERPITFVVPHAPGGYTDLTARLTARYVEALGKPVVIDSRPGGGESSAPRLSCSAARRLYLLRCSVGAISVAPFAQKVGYDPAVGDLAPSHHQHYRRRSSPRRRCREDDRRARGLRQGQSRQAQLGSSGAGG